MNHNGVKKAAGITAALPLVVLAAACGGGDDSVTLTFAHTLETSHPVHHCGVEGFVERVEGGTGGEIEFEVYPALQLGSEAEQADSTIAGDIDISQPNSGHLSNYYEPLSVLDAAFLYDDYEDMLEVAQSEEVNELFEGLNEETGLEVLSVWPQGQRHVTTSDTPVQHPDDLQGVSMRAIDSPIGLANVEALGASPTPIALGELYTGLQQGVVEAQENPINLIQANSLHEVQGYVSLTAHVILGNPLIMNGDSFDSLTDEQQEVLLEAAAETAHELPECLESEVEEILAEWEEAGSPEIIEDVDREAFREQAVPVLLDEFGDAWDGRYEEIRGAIEDN